MSSELVIRQICVIMSCEQAGFACIKGIISWIPPTNEFQLPFSITAVHLPESKLRDLFNKFLTCNMEQGTGQYLRNSQKRKN